MGRLGCQLTQQGQGWCAQLLTFSKQDSKRRLLSGFGIMLPYFTVALLLCICSGSASAASANPSSPDVFSDKMGALFKNQYDQVSGQYVPGKMGPNHWNKIPGDCLAAILKELLVIANFYQIWNPFWTRKECEQAAFTYYAELRVPYMLAVSSSQQTILDAQASLFPESSDTVASSSMNKTKTQAGQRNAAAQLAVTFAAMDSPSVKQLAQKDKGQMLLEAAKYMILPSGATSLPKDTKSVSAKHMDLVALNKEFNPQLFSR